MIIFKQKAHTKLKSCTLIKSFLNLRKKCIDGNSLGIYIYVFAKLKWFNCQYVGRILYYINNFNEWIMGLIII